MRKINLKILWITVASILLTLSFFVYYGDDSELVLKISLSLSGIFMILSLATYENKVHISMLFMVLSTIIGYIPSGFSNGKIEIPLSIIAMVTTLIIAIKAIRKQSRPLKDLIKIEVKPVNIHNTIRVILYILIITVIFRVSNSYRNISGENVTCLASAYTILPVLALLLSITPVYDVILIRIVHNLLWIYIIQMAADIKMASQINMFEPVVYIVTIIISSSKIKQTRKVEEKNNG